MRVAILQPGYLPWIGYFDQMNQVDLFVHATDLQYTRQDWRSRNRIKTRTGWQWLTVPVHSKGNFFAPIHTIRVNNTTPWARKHLNLIREHYRTAPFFDQYFPLFQEALSHTWEYLLDLDLYFIDLFKNLLQITTHCIDIRDLPLPQPLDRVERIIQTCLHLQATFYLSGDAARNYLDEAFFSPHKITLQFHDMPHPVYPQLHGPFISHLSAIDLLFNCGPESPSYLPSAAARPPLGTNTPNQ